jgi:hypothetical protein
MTKRSCTSNVFIAVFIITVIGVLAFSIKAKLEHKLDPSTSATEAAVKSLVDKLPTEAHNPRE